MIVKQVTVTVENKEGRLKEVMDILGKENINVEALSMADTVLRLIVADPEETMNVLKRHKYEVHLTDVLRIKVPSQPGVLGNMLVSIAAEKINLEYMYAFATGSGDEMIIRPSDVKKADELLSTYEAI
ncbi:MAG: acetolactate synthase [Eubacterium sp.]|nr:acetolactate synthase [Eubacterium sp.]MDD7209158.1 acetolactate synthase [Lachnospiraceae bacterium]MDY5498047.1 acetolactate synthase [Anaerobutyricum sp.]